MTKYIVSEPEIDDDGNISIPVEMYDSVPEAQAAIRVVVTAEQLLALSELEKAERIAGYQALIETEPRMASFLDSNRALEQFTGDLDFPAEIEE